MTRLGLHKLAWFSAAWLALIAFRLGLSLSSYTRVKRWFRQGDGTRPLPPQLEQDRCAWSIIRAARLVPFASCLTQALAGRWLLERLGYQTTVVIGVRRPDHASLAAHAWLRAGDSVILGATTEDLSAFTVLTELGFTA